MTYLLLALAVAFAAFCVWLTIRIVNRRELWAKWTAVGIMVIGLPMLYVLSFGPAYKLHARQYWIGGQQRQAWFVIYEPLELPMHYGPNALRKALNWYVELWL